MSARLMVVLLVLPPTLVQAMCVPCCGVLVPEVHPETDVGDDHGHENELGDGVKHSVLGARGHLLDCQLGSVPDHALVRYGVDASREDGSRPKKGSGLRREELRRPRVSGRSRHRNAYRGFASQEGHA